MEAIINLWKELKISYCQMDFTCGGDSMGETSFRFVNENEEEVNNSKLESYFEDSVYTNVDFYVNSDGHYQGESGNVRIEFDEDDQDFTYSKTSESEYSENESSEMEVELDQKTIEFIKKNILNINGSQDDMVVNYKRDLILKDEDVALVETLKETISNEAAEHEPDLSNGGELEEYYTFTTNGEGEELKITDNKLTIQMSNSVTVFK